MYVTALMDVEDLVAPESDDIAGECANILAEEGVRATLCIVGEKARLLRQRGRADVIRALGQHDIGIHTDFHSVPPTILDFLSDKDWEEGVTEALRRERPGVEAIQEVFGVTPSCWGGPGNTWGPQICEAMRQLHVPAFVYAHTRTPGGGVHRFAGLLAYPGGRSINDGAYHDEPQTRLDRARLQEDLLADSAAAAFWQEAFLGHPTRILHTAFWDAMNFSDGVNTPRADWKPAPRKAQADLDTALKNFRETARMLRSLPGIELKTIREMNALLQDAPAAPLSATEQASVWPEIATRLRGMTGWPVLRPALDISRVLSVTQAQLPTLQSLHYPTPE